MKKLFLLLPLLLPLSPAFSQTSITAQIKNPQPGKIYLSLQKGVQPALIDSTDLDTKGNFSFTLTEGFPQGVYQLQLDKFKQAPLIIANEKKITLAASYDELKEGTIQFVASKENDAYAVLSNFFSIYSKEVDSLKQIITEISRFDPKYDAKLRQTKTDYSRAVVRFNNSIRLLPNLFPGTFAAQVLLPLYLVPDRSESKSGKDFDTEEAFQHAHFFDDINFTDSRIINTATYETKLFTYLDSYTEHTDDGFKESVDNIMLKAKQNDAVRDFTISYLLDVFTKKGPPQMVEYVHDNFSQGCEIPMNAETEKLLNKLKQVGIGTPAPELAISDINYKPLSLKATIKGKLGMIYFWASSCPHCMEHTPKVYDVYQKYKSKGFEVYAVSLDNDYAAWLKAIQDMKLEWINVSELKGWQSEVIATYALERTPTIFLVDKAGNILDKNFSPSELESKLKKYLE